MGVMVDYRWRCVYAVRDLLTVDAPVVFELVVYGRDPESFFIVGDENPCLVALQRRDIDINRYRAMLWDGPADTVFRPNKKEERHVGMVESRSSHIWKAKAKKR